jgi:hypothetical protein
MGKAVKNFFDKALYHQQNTRFWDQIYPQQKNPA